MSVFDLVINNLKIFTENTFICRFSPTDKGDIINSNIIKSRLTTFLARHARTM